MGHQPKQQPDYEPDFDPDAPEKDDSSPSEHKPEPSPGASSPAGMYRGLEGRTLGERYRFEELIGEGTFARVFRVYDQHRRAYLAAKVLRSDIAQEPAFLERFRREATVLSHLQHPNIVRYYETVEADGYVFILTDYIAGPTLQNVLHQQASPITPFDSLQYVRPLASALHYAHGEGIIHRDLKPANVLIDESGSLYVMDFGIARILSDASTLTRDTTIGTPHYMSPEQILAGDVNEKTDIYAMGVLLYQMYTGRLPFTGESEDVTGTTSAVRIVYEHLHVAPEPPTSINPRLSVAVERVILRCLEKDPDQRYASVAELYDALSDAIGTPSISLNQDAVAAALVNGPAAPLAERVPTGVGGESKIIPERELRADYAAGEVDDFAEDSVLEADLRRKPKRKTKPQVIMDRETAADWFESEKSGEKEGEKQQEKDDNTAEKEREKGPEKADAWSGMTISDRLSQFTWGGITLWAGIVYLLHSDDLGGSLFNNTWAWIIGGAGALFLVEVAARLTIPEFRARPGIRLIIGVVLLMVGLGMGIGMGSFWPLILIGVGVSILLNHLTR
ncbi:MAG: protein kinase [Anaerolineae bacterium]|nr:protein kinase [Anaerolineae bacterium]